MIKRILLALPVLLPLLLAAQINIKGKVIDANTGTPLPGAHVSINNNLKVAISRQDGIFEFENLKKGNYELQVTYVGYSNWNSEINLVEEKTILVSLQPTTLTITEEAIIQSTRAGDKTPVAASTIDKNAIKRLDQGRDLPYILENMPATVSTSDAGTGIGYSGFRIRGTDMNRINITVNGIPLNDAESHGVFWVNMPDFASSVGSLQVQRGVGTSTNGAAAFGASVNLQTSTPPADAYGEITSAAGSFNSFKNSVSAGTGLINGKWAIDSRLSRITSDGFIDRASANLKSFYISSGYYGTNTIFKLNVFSGYEKTYQAWEGIPSDILKDNRTYNPVGMYTDNQGNTHYYDNEIDNYQQDHYQAMLAHKLSNKVTANIALHYTRGRGYYEQYKDNESLEDYGISPVIIPTMNPSENVTIEESDIIRRKNLDNHFYGLTWSVNYTPFNRLKLVAGGSGNIYDGDHFGDVIWAEYASNFQHDYRWYEGNGTKKDLNVYLKANYQGTDRLSLYGDLQLRGINYTISGTDDDLRDITQSHDFLFFNPKMGAYLDIHNNGSVYASFAIAHREPNRDNYTDADPSQPSPVAERLYDYELGYQYKTSAILLNANVYYMYYHDQLILTGQINDVGSAIMTNVPESYRAGIELSGNFKLSENFSLYAHSAFSNNKILNFVEFVDDWDNWGSQVRNDIGRTDLAFSPNMVAGAELQWKTKGGFSASFDGKYVSRQYIDNTSSIDRSLDAYLVNNLKINYSFKPRFVKEVQLNLAVNNIFDSKYETNAWVYRYMYEGEYGVLDGYFPQAGINFMTGLTIKL